MKLNLAVTMTILFLFSAQTQSQAPPKPEPGITYILEDEWTLDRFPNELLVEHNWRSKAYIPGDKDAEYLKFEPEDTSYHLLVRESKKKPGYCNIYNGSLAAQGYLLQKAIEPNPWLRKTIRHFTTHRIPVQAFTVFHLQGLKESSDTFSARIVALD
ncbi:hypothetical protein PCANC_15018 [Puccinia coronata f. sp. avenae]|uniref:Uncharacterized protein n=1 Tax=Puccinia coronata f. sp. avenae TaxID=200324 RepID=A0A2N5STL6_9BASI|nr:hypothetical protein PCANC_15018 [Puccinia coronata f. sp. avenae]